MGPKPKSGISGIKKPGKRSTISEAAKLEILKTVDANRGRSRAAIAKQCKIAATTLETIIKNRAKIEAAGLQGSQKRRRLKISKYPAVENALSLWIAQARALPVKVPLSGANLKAQARLTAGRLKISNFTACNGWINRFRKRYTIAFRKASGESADVQTETVKTWTENALPKLIEGYELCDIYNADEFGLFFNLLPDKSMVDKNDDGHGNKQSKARDTVMLCSNADGSDKLIPLVIGKSKKPRCFSNLRTLPCTYASQSSAWMTQEECTTWLRKLDAKMRIARRKVILFLDNCPAHPQNLQFANVKVVIFSKNCTSKLQPLDQGVIRNVKNYYRTRLVHRLINFIGKTGVQKKEFYINLYQALHFLQWAWIQVTPQTIRNCFRKAGFLDEDERAAAAAARAVATLPPPTELSAQAEEQEEDVDGDLEEQETSADDDSIDCSGSESSGDSEEEEGLDSEDEVDEAADIIELEVAEDEEHEFQGELEPIEVDETMKESSKQVRELLGIDVEVPFSAYVVADDRTPIYEAITVEQFADNERQQDAQNESDGEGQEEDEFDEVHALVSSAEGLAGVDTVRRFATNSMICPRML